MSKQVKEFSIGEETTCQFGNAYDTYGYAENIPVRVIGKHNPAGTIVYLVRRLDQDNYVGTAVRYPRPEMIEGELYCTTAVRFGTAPDIRGCATIENAAYALGFSPSAILKD